MRSNLPGHPRALTRRTDGMDAQRFDSLARQLSTAKTRRRLLGVLASVPLLAEANVTEALASQERKRRAQVQAQRRERRRTFCLNGLTIRARRRKWRRLLAKGATRGRCPAVCVPTCAGKTCGASDGCSGTCSAGPCPGSQQCCDGTCRDCPCDQLKLSNGACVTQCVGPEDCLPGCACFLTPGFCGRNQTGISCPNGDIDCPSGQFCNTQSDVCTIAC